MFLSLQFSTNATSTRSVRVRNVRLGTGHEFGLWLLALLGCPASPPVGLRFSLLCGVFLPFCNFKNKNSKFFRYPHIPTPVRELVLEYLFRDWSCNMRFCSYVLLLVSQTLVRFCFWRIRIGMVADLEYTNYHRIMLGELC